MWDKLIDLARRELAGDDPTGPADGLDLVADAETVARAFAGADGTDPQLDLEFEDDPDGVTPGTPSTSDPIEDVLAPYRDRPPREGSVTVPRINLMGGPPLPPEVIARWLCTAWVRRVIRDPETGHVLDYGRRQRLFNRNQRRAMAHRDGGCGFPGCDLGPRYCDAHHVPARPDDGQTNIDDGLLLCRRHHSIVHTKGWTLGRDPTTGIVTVTTPDGRTFSHRPNHLGRRP